MKMQQDKVQLLSCECGNKLENDDEVGAGLCLKCIDNAYEKMLDEAYHHMEYDYEKLMEESQKEIEYKQWLIDENESTTPKRNKCLHPDDFDTHQDYLDASYEDWMFG